MKEFFSSWISIVVEILTIMYSYSWLQRTHEEEPKIVLVAAFGTLITSVFFRISAKPKIIFYLHRSGVRVSAIKPSRLTSKTSQLGQMSGIKDITRIYELLLVNNSNNMIFNPELYIHKDFQNLIFTGTFSSSNPIKPADKIEIQFKYTKTIEGSPVDFKKEEGISFPDEFNTSFRLLCSYENEKGKKYYTTMKIENNKPINRTHSDMDKDLVKVKVYEPIY